MGRKADNKRYICQRILLIQLMGAKCRYCSERRIWKLEFHHLKRVNWKPDKTGRLRKIRLYARDWGEGILVLACGRCNKKQGVPKTSHEPEIPIPF